MKLIKKKKFTRGLYPDVLSGGPSYWSGLYGPVSWLIFFQFEPHGLVRSVQREIFSGCPYGDTTTRISDP